MALQDLIGQINQDTHDETERILREAKKEATQITQEFRAQEEALVRTHKEQLARTLEDNKKRVAARAEQEAATRIAQAKRTAIERAFTAALRELASLPGKDYEAFLASCIRTLPSERSAATITVPKERADETTKILKRHGVTGTTHTSTDLSGGFILSDSKAEYNFSFERLITDKKGELEGAVADMLFSASA